MVAIAFEAVVGIAGVLVVFLHPPVGTIRGPAASHSDIQACDSVYVAEALECAEFLALLLVEPNAGFLFFGKRRLATLVEGFNRF